MASTGTALLYDTIVYVSERRNCIDTVFDFYSFLLHVSGVFFSDRQEGILVHRKTEKGEAPPLTNSQCTIIVKFIIIPKTKQ